MKALVFDLDDTLVVEEASAEAAFLETCELAKLQYGVDPRALHATVRETCRDLWHKSPARELADTFRRNRRKRHIVYDDGVPALEILSRIYRLGLLTNGASDLQREKIDGSGIGKHFREIVISGDLGFGKPDPRIFRIMLNRLGAEPEETIMIGNSQRSDIGGARSVGMRTVWVNRDGSVRNDTIVPDMEVENLGPLIQAFQPGAGGGPSS